MPKSHYQFNIDKKRSVKNYTARLNTFRSPTRCSDENHGIIKCL